MKKTAILLVSLLSLGWAYAQNFYIPSYSTQAYSQLAAGTKLMEIPGNPGLYQLSLPKAMTLFEEKTDTTLIIGDDGFIVTSGPSFAMAIDPFLSELLVGSGNSGVYVEFDSTTSPARLSVEWRGMLLEGHPSTDFVNFKLHLFSDQSVEYHYGPSQVTSDSAFGGNPGPDVYLILFDKGFTTPYEYHKVSGPPASPSFEKTPSLNKLLAVPPSGTVYRYKPFDLGQQGDDRITAFKFYPNPVTDRMKIEGVENAMLSITSMDAQKVATVKIENGTADLSQLKPGYYLAKTGKEEGGQSYLKILKQ